MLTEQFVAAVGVPTRAPGTNATKDVGIFINESQPLNAQRTVFKKSATLPNGLAISATHVFAAQAGKGVVHVYQRQKGNQEATVPFTEKLTCIALACNDTVLVCGTAEGRIFLWEIASGRQVTTAQSHLQAVNALAVDPTSNFLLSASADSTVHTWSIPKLLSFSDSGIEPLSPSTTFTSHNASVNCLAVGHSATSCNIAVSGSSDQTCLVWDYHTNTLLRTFLLTSIPLSLALDPADRAIYVGHQDGSVQQLNLFASEGQPRQLLMNRAQRTTSAAPPIQPPPTSIWRSPDSTLGPALCVSVSFDGNTVLSGHENGNMLMWDVARPASPASLLPLPHAGPITNVSFLPAIGFTNDTRRTVTISTVTKPKFGAFDSAMGIVPDNYALNVELSLKHPGSRISPFEQALHGPTFPVHMIDEGLHELLHWGQDHGGNALLQAELDALRRLQKASFEKIEKVNAEKRALLDREHKRLAGVHSLDTNGHLDPESP
ncbi:WD40-repeat-containing domain protein [Neohortaea acidophila]|uniref:Pre-rRNA-processing protein IPI3 n=1 Tax=Neohortaea acidophila TaxID=245834 RepID=A0A6A6Q3Y3_9PEZI|nr:WD40-repeat-containing domain protein [Neohortaea acidophila]KAF2486107.1 WD40-repeat-containing domain protein [Neohortaea acidophila]